MITPGYGRGPCHPYHHEPTPSSKNITRRALERLDTTLTLSGMWRAPGVPSHVLLRRPNASDSSSTAPRLRPVERSQACRSATETSWDNTSRESLWRAGCEVAYALTTCARSADTGDDTWCPRLSTPEARRYVAARPPLVIQVGLWMDTSAD
jgi:hypothetical protein